jgi:hypothetical protein
MLRYRVFLYSLLLLSGLSGPIWAQTANSTLSGVVKDQNGDVIAGVQVRVLNTGNAQTREISTGNEGTFTAPVLPAGNYSLTLIRTGFAPLEITGITLGVGEERAFQVELKIGTLREQVRVEAHAVFAASRDASDAPAPGNQN